MLTPKQVELAYRTPVVDQLRDTLKDIYTPEEFGLWLALPHKLLDGQSALEAIHDGHSEKVLRIASGLADGVYI